jgi:hypothetical protein
MRQAHLAALRTLTGLFLYALTWQATISTAHAAAQSEPARETALLQPLVAGLPTAPAGLQASPASPAALQPSLVSTATEPAVAIFNWRRDPIRPQSAAATQSGLSAQSPDPDEQKILNWETGAGKSYLIPALEVPAFLILLNAYDRTVLHSKTQEGQGTYDTNFSTTWDHLRKQNWRFDRDPFTVNQIGHPYQGATMYGIARSAGLSFWQSLGYSNAGSFLWEMAGENSRPSINDIFTTGNAGSLLGEALFRMSQLVLKEESPRPDTWHELGAAVLSPPTAFNRWAYGERFKTIFPSHDPALFWRGRLGASLSGDSDQAATLDFQMSYGLPGKPGYTYQRPFDYFDFQIGGLSKANNPLSYILLRGLLYGRDYHQGENYRGVWGLYGLYDYFSPTAFRISTTGLALGTTGQYWMAHEVALQGTVLGGVGFGAAGQTPSTIGRRDYHYGVAPHTLVALRLLLGNRAALELVGRGYYVSGTGSDNSEGSEQIARITTGVTVRVFRRHGIGVQFVESVRHAQYGNLPSSHQSDGTVGIYYTFLGDSHFGSVEWRDLGSR